jgi:transaldolase
MGESLWLDNITRGLLTSGTLGRYIQDFSVTGLTSNPTIFDHAIKNSHDYDDAKSRPVKHQKKKDEHDSNHRTTHSTRGVEGPRGALREDPRVAPPQALR